VLLAPPRSSVSLAPPRSSAKCPPPILLHEIYLAVPYLVKEIEATRVSSESGDAAEPFLPHVGFYSVVVFTETKIKKSQLKEISSLCSNHRSTTSTCVINGDIGEGDCIK